MITRWFTRKRIGWTIGIILAQVLILALVAAAGVVFAWVRIARSQPDLSGWHREAPHSEFVASDAKTNYTFADYLKQEDKVFAELDALVKGPWAGVSAGPYCRYQANSVCNPDKILERNWNRTFVLESKEPSNSKGGVLLVHGLSDAPYSLRALGERLHAAGYTVIGLRVPGHGTSPKALADSKWTDWAAAVRIAMLGLRDKTPSGKPIIMVGYSNGGALSVNYTVAALNPGTASGTPLPRPDGLVLISPMIAITPMAEFTEIYPTVARLTGEKKLSWSNIEPEIDPFKYSSWPTNASLQAFRITRQVQAEMNQLVANGRIANFPPVLAVQSAADATVLAQGVMDDVLDKLPQDRGEMVLFDVNRATRMEGLMGTSFESAIRPRIERGRTVSTEGTTSTLPYTLTLVANRDADSLEVVARTYSRAPMVETDLKLTWPHEIFSLSHVALPIPPTDRVYGLGTTDSPQLLPLGTFALRGERGVLSISPGLMMRMRFNPFYDWTENRIMTWIEARTPTK